jgi:hypothetical protein
MKFVIRSHERDPLPSGTWKERMTTFMNNHMDQLQEYDQCARLIVHDKLARFARGAGVPYRTLENACHKNAIVEIIKLFTYASESTVRLKISSLITNHAALDKREDFQEIAFVFAIIVNAPQIKKQETCWEN